MANNAYLRSVKKERAIVNKLRKGGFYAARSAGSKSPFDVYGFNPKTKEAVLIQVKTKRGGRGFRISGLETFKNVKVKTWTVHYE